MDDKQTGDNVRLLKGHIQFYLDKVAGVGCPPECPHFSPYATESCDAGCQLEKLHPWDCLDATAGDLSRFLIGSGWTPPSSAFSCIASDGVR